MTGSSRARLQTQIETAFRGVLPSRVDIYLQLSRLSVVSAGLPPCLPPGRHPARPDVGWYLVGALRTQRAQRTTDQRLELFGEDQRSAVADVLRHIVESWSDERAEKLLAEWPNAAAPLALPR